MDVALTHAGAPGVTLWRNVEGKRFERVPLPISDATRGWGLTAIDFDNDGWIDLAVVLETAHGPELRVLRNLGEQGFEDVSAKLGLDKIKLVQSALGDRCRRGWRQRFRSRGFAAWR